MPPPDSDDPWSTRVRDALSRYDEPVLRRVAGKLFKARIGQPADELVGKAADTQTNAPVIDRRIRDLPEAACVLIGLVGVSRQPRWKVGHLIHLLAAAGHADGFAPVQALLDSGLAFPELRAKGPPLKSFEEWLGGAGTLAASVFVHPAVLVRARGFLSRGRKPPEDKLGGLTPPAQGVVTDGLEWPLRLAAVWQQVRTTPIRLTQANTLFKRDFGRLQADPVLAAPFAEAADVPETGVLALFWAAAAGLLTETDLELRSASFPEAWDRGLWTTLAELFAAFFTIDTWDPLRGYGVTDNGVSPTPTAGLIALARLASAAPGTWVPAEDLAAWLWEHHPGWPGTLTKDVQKQYGTPWVEAFLLAIAAPLRVVESARADGWQFRLSDFGRHLFVGEPEPPPPAAFPQTLLVQPNAEVLAYRQGLTPQLIARLSRFARWKQVGPACTLELCADETYRGLESGLTLADVTQTLDRHGMRPVPANVADLLRRWADKRERITVYSSATLVEFASPADLDTAVARGIVSVRLTDRIGLTADGGEPDFKHLRLIGNRDYEAKPQQCVLVADDGVTLTVDAAQSDLLLEAEVGRLADPVPGDNPAVRTYRVTPDTLRRVVAGGMSLDDLERWFVARTGEPLPPAGRLFVVGPGVSPPTAARLIVVQFPTAELTDGVVQWPATAAFVERRLGPAAVVVADEQLAEFRDVLREIGISVQLSVGYNRG
jgi:hypothetical protein